MRASLLNIAAGVLTLASLTCFAGPASAQQRYLDHQRYHDNLDHSQYHRNLDHREAHRYPMTWRQHDRLHDALNHDAYHNYLDHREYHRQLYTPVYPYGTYGYPSGGSYGYPSGGYYPGFGIGIQGRNFSFYLGN